MNQGGGQMPRRTTVKQGRTLVELAQEIERQREAAHDYKAPTQQLTLTAVAEETDAKRKLQLKLNGKGQFGLTPLAHDQIGQHTGIPSKYYDRMAEEAPELLVKNVNHWLTNNPTTRLVRTMDGQVRAFLSNRYRTIDNWQVAEAILPTLLDRGNGLKVESCEVTDTRLYIKVVDPKNEAKIEQVRAENPGSHSRPKEEIVVQSGIIISNSEVGLHSFKIEPLVFILACYNGAIIPKAGMWRYHIGRHTDEADVPFEVFADDTRQADDRALALKMRDTVKSAFDEVSFHQLCKTLSSTTGRTIERGPESLAETIEEVYGFTNGTKDGILKELAQAGDYTQWGLSNAVTAFAQDKSIDYEQATELERVGGDILMLAADEWTRKYGKAA